MLSIRYFQFCAPVIHRSSLILTRELNVATQSSEFTEKPIYPEILDNNIKERKIRKANVWHEEIKSCNTVEEKIIKINMPKYYGYKCVMLGDEKFHYNCLPLTKHYTRTHLEIVKNLPNYYDKYQKDVDIIAESLKTEIIEMIESSDDYFKYTYGEKNLSQQEKDKKFGDLIVNQINQLLLKALIPKYPHLKEVCVDKNARHEAFWWVGQVQLLKKVQSTYNKVAWLKDRANDLMDRTVQYIGEPYMAIRHRLPLSAIVAELSDKTEGNVEEIPLFTYDARTLGYCTKIRHGTIIPGFWPGSPHEFGLLSYQHRNHMVERKARYDDEDNQEALHAQGIQSSFAWLYAQACYQGFSSFNDVTYPLSTQTIITNGQFWSFYAYTLNTTLLHSNNPIANPKKNHCWGSEEMKLYEQIDENSKCTGFNLDVLKNIINFYINEPVERNYNMKPYLAENEKYVADIKDDSRRKFLDRLFKHLSSNRPKHLLVPEIYMWEKIYKIDNNTRPLDAKKRYFERSINPFARTLDQHTPVYIPKSFRPAGPKSRKKWEKTYYP